MFNFQLSSQLDIWEDKCRRVELSNEVGVAEMLLQVHGDSTLHMQNVVFEVMQMGQEFLQVSILMSVSFTLFVY